MKNSVFHKNKIRPFSFYLFLTFLLFQINLFGQEEWVFNFKDGTSISGELSKEFISANDNVLFVNEKTGKKEKVHSDKLLNFEYKTKGQTFVFEKKYKLAKNFGKTIKRSAYKLWAAKIYGTDKIEAFVFFDYFPHAGNPYGKTFYMTTGYRITAEDYLINVGLFSQHDDVVGYKAWSKSMCVVLKKAFKYSCPTFSKKITSKSYYIDEYKKIADDFTEICN